MTSKLSATTRTTRIALTGKLRSGKDTVAERMWIYNDGFYPLAFGNALKQTYHELFPWIPKKPKPRAGYQSYGQQMRELYGDDLWIRHVEARVNSLEKFRDCLGMVITDLRQQNEYDWCRANGFAIVRVTASDDVRKARAVAAGDDFTVHDFAHDTELHVDSFDVDYEIVNDGDLMELYAKVDAVMAEITKGAD